MSKPARLTVVVIHPSQRRAESDAAELRSGGLQAFSATGLTAARRLIADHHPDAIVCEAGLALEAGAALGAPTVVTAMRLTADDFELLRRERGVTALVSGFDPPGTLKNAVTAAAVGSDTDSPRVRKRVVLPARAPSDRARWRSLVFVLSQMAARQRKPLAEQRDLTFLVAALSMVGANGLAAWLETPAGADAPELGRVLKRCGLTRAHQAFAKVLRLFPSRWPRDEGRRERLLQELKPAHRAEFDRAGRALNAILDSAQGLAALRRWANAHWDRLTHGDPPWEQPPREP